MVNKKFWVGIGISLIFLYFAVKNIEFDKLLKVISEINYFYIVPTIFFTIFTYIIRAWRWRYFFKHVKPIKFHSLFSAVMIGFMANNVLPARIGEFIRADCIGRKENISRSMSFATIVLERVFDGFSVLFLFVVTLFFCPYPPYITRIGYIAAAIYLVITAISISLRIWKKQFIRLIELLCNRLSDRIGKAIVKHTHSFIGGFDVLKNGWDIAIIFFYSLILWIVSAISFYIMILGCNINHITFIGAIFILIMVAIGIAIPSSPGYVGTFQYFIILALSVFNVDKTTALSYSIVLHAIQFVVPTVIGWIYLCKEHISFKEIKGFSKHNENNQL